MKNNWKESRKRRKGYCTFQVLGRDRFYSVPCRDMGSCVATKGGKGRKTLCRDKDFQVTTELGHRRRFSCRDLMF